MNQNVDKQQNFMKWLKETPTYTTTIPQTANAMQATTTTTGKRYEGYDKQEEQFRNATTSFVQQQQQQQPETLNKFSTHTKKVSGKPKSDKCNRPTNITTQIAKISYKSDLSSKRRSASKERFTNSHPNNDDNISPITHESRTSLTSDIKNMELEENQNLLKEFAKKKQERDQEISEIQEMLNKIKSPKKTTPHSTEELENDNLRVEKQTPEEVKIIPSKEMPKPSTFCRSKTELQMESKSKTQEESLNHRNSRRDTARSSVSQINKPRSKSSQLPVTQKDSEPAKKIGYDPVDARRFMENQKKLRKSNGAINLAESTKMEKEKIKKRLEELKKNSRKLVSKNLQKKQNTMTNKQITTTNKEHEDKNLELKPKETFIITKTIDPKELTAEDLKGLSLDLQQQQPFSTNIKTDRPKTTKKILTEVTSRSTYSLTTILAPPTFPLLENHKRIGLLRKSENDKDFSVTSHRAINLDKENMVLEQLTNKLNTPLAARQSKEKKEIRDKHLESPKAQENEILEKLEEPKDISLSSKNLPVEEQVSDLEVPQNTLKTKECKEPLEQQTFRKEDLTETTEQPAKPNDLPYWLRPSAAQVYPYNFIMAVRRKLEAIAQPHSQVIRSKHNQCTSTTDLDTDLQHKLKKRKSLECPEEQEVKKLKKKAEEDDAKSSKEDASYNKTQKQIKTNSENKIQEQTIKPLKIKQNTIQELASIKQLKPLPKPTIASYQLEEPKTKCSAEEPVSQFQYLQKSIQSKDFVGVKPINWQNSKTKSFMDLQAIPPFKPLQKKSVQRPSSDQEELKESSLQFKLPKNYKSMDSLNSEIHSNLSSISLHNPISNTLTEVSSLRTESRRTFNQPGKTQHGSEDEITSISSHIFSSPEKKCTKLQDFEFTKPRPVSPLSLEKVDKLQIKRKDHGKDVDKDGDNADIEMDFSQLLEDFNRSLSQVIQVNEQLKCSLDKSQQILSPRTESDKQYSSDFESSTKQSNKHLMKSEKLKENLQINNENLKQRKQQLFEMAEKVKPLLSPKKTLKTSDKNEAKPKELNLEINLKSLNNSSNLSQEDTTNTTESRDDQQSFETTQVYEERLQQIEKLKINLKQTLLESQKERQESDRLKANELKTRNYMTKERKVSETSKDNNQETKNDETTRRNLTKLERNGKEALSRKDNSSNYYKENRDTKNQSVKQSGIETLYENEEFCKAALSLNTQISNENKSIAQIDPAAQSEKERFIENPKNYHKELDLKDKYRKQYKKSLVEFNGNETHATLKSSQTSVLYSLGPPSQQVKNSYEERHGNETYLNKKSLETHNRSNAIATNSNETQYLHSYSSQSASQALNRRQNYGNSKTLTDYSNNQSDKNSSNSSPVKSFSTNPTHTLMETSKSPQKPTNNRSSQSHTSNSNSKNTESESGTAHSQRQSNIESLASKGDKSQLKSQPTTNQPDALSSSIAEELQNTFESASQDNENIPLHKSTSSQSTKNHSKHNDNSAFINSHINRSRGDFLQIDSSETKLNETKFQQAILSAAHLSSTEFAQSADDEVTSSEASKTNKAQSSNPPSYNAISSSKHYKQPLTTSSPSKSTRRISIGSEIVRFFHQYDSEKSQSHSKINDTMSESSLNYSNIGLYDKLIQNETSKSQHLTALLKMREKALLDRTKGQIAWLEVQKARYKAKGLLSHIAAIKKKQRGILLKMEKEREEIKRLLQSTTKQTAAATQTSSGGPKPISHHNTPTKHKREKLPSSKPGLRQPALGKLKSANPQSLKSDQPLSAPILRATYELESSHALEELLIKREDDLRRRREHVERLMQWHQRLDEEEAEVLNLERQLLNYNNVPQVVEQQQTKLPAPAETTEKLTQAEPTVATESPEAQAEPTIKTPEKKRASRARKMEKRLKEIDKSLRDLSHISASSTNTSGPVMGQTTNNDIASDSNSVSVSVSSAGTHEVDFVRITGIKLNKLWKRLTSQQLEKFEPTRRYKLCKSDLERLYEEAKMAVLRDFAEDEDRLAQELLEKSSTNLSSTTSPIANTATSTAPVHLQGQTAASVVEIPVLNLNFSSGNSEPEEESANNSNANPTNVGVPEGNYSPSVAEENFKAHLLNSSASSSSESSEQRSTSSGRKEQTRLENNVQMFLAITQRITSAGRVAGLQRSLSDTEIADKPKFCAESTTTSQKNIATAASQTNSSIGRTTNISTIEHQRSKSSIVELTTNIPLTPTDRQTNSTDKDGDELTHRKAHLKDLDTELSNHLSSRSSVIRSVGKVTTIIHPRTSSSDIPTLTEDPKTSTTPSTDSFKHKATFSGQVGVDCETRAKEISTKLEEISVAVSQLSKSNALPSYSSVTHKKTKAVEEQLPVATVTTCDDSNLSTDASSYSFNFDNISTDRHSSPGIHSQHNLQTNSTSNRTITSITYTKDNTEVVESEMPEAIPKDRSSGSVTQTSAAAESSTSLNSTNSKTFVQDCPKSSSFASEILTQSLLDNRISETYEADFETDLSNDTHIEDITIPTFEITGETTQDDDDVEENTRTTKPSSSSESQELVENLSTEATDKTYCADAAAKDTINQTIEQSISSPKPLASNSRTSPDKELLPAAASSIPTPPPPPPPPSLSTSSTAVDASSLTNSNQLMPDIINELELRRHQLILENEHLKQYEHVTAVPYMYVREIPNKPPPPYVPPAHGSPMTTIFPSEERIKDITYRRTHELYCELLKTEYCTETGDKLPSVMEEQITNIYERIILDICREYLEERGEILRDGDPTNFHSQLAFFNPPNRLRCIQDAIYKEVRLCLAMDKTQPKRTQIYSVYGQRAKQDHIGKIIIQEMYDEDDRWCNFHREESEVLHLMVEEMINNNIREIAKDVLIEEGGTIEDDDEEEEEEEEVEDVEEKEEDQEENDENQEIAGILENQTYLESSVFIETINEDDPAHSLNESKQDCSSLKAPTKDLQPETTTTTATSSPASPNHNESV